MSCWKISTTESLGWKSTRQHRLSRFSGRQLGLSPVPTLASFLSHSAAQSVPLCRCTMAGNSDEGTKLTLSHLTKRSQRALATHARKSCSEEEPPVGCPCQDLESLVAPEHSWLMCQFLWLPRMQRDSFECPIRWLTPALPCGWKWDGEEGYWLKVPPLSLTIDYLIG